MSMFAFGGLVWFDLKRLDSAGFARCLLALAIAIGRLLGLCVKTTIAKGNRNGQMLSKWETNALA